MTINKVKKEEKKGKERKSIYRSAVFCPGILTTYRRIVEQRLGSLLSGYTAYVSTNREKREKKRERKKGKERKKEGKKKKRERKKRKREKKEKRGEEKNLSLGSLLSRYTDYVSTNRSRVGNDESKA